MTTDLKNNVLLLRTAGTKKGNTMNLLRVDASIRSEGSVSRQLGDAVEQQWRQQHPDGTVTRRDVGSAPLPPLWHAGVPGSHLPPEQRTPEQARAAALVDELVGELLAADAIVIGAPIYNWGVPQGLKQWIDLICLDARPAASDGTFLAGRQAIVVESRGGGYDPGTPREGWDFVTPYLTRLLGDAWGLELSFARAELTSADQNPAMAFLREQAKEQLAEAETSAASHVTAVLDRLRSGARTNPSR
ncbi:FMN-dependent NADH-azoreductase [Streptomyces griseorubiginosus]|uniref:FMN-dependent NADH-azoreductase n=1 Tax=Streptomyces griseorubiginosus TaxID=67304 RepID=UPI0014055D2A